MIQPTFAIPAGFKLPPPPNGAQVPASTPAVPGPPPPSPVNHEALVAEYRQIRDSIADQQKAFEASIKPLKERREAIENILLDDLNRSGANSVNTNSGTAYKTTRTSYGVEDPAAFRAWAEAHGHLDFFENRVSKEAIENWVNEGKQLPPGIKVSTFTTVNIRK